MKKILRGMNKGLLLNIVPDNQVMRQFIEKDGAKMLDSKYWYSIVKKN